jgi:carboxymethylenebutenolidase
MSDQSIEINTADGTADGYVHRPSGEGPWPGVIHLTDVGGIRTSNLALAARLADEGYVVLTPNLFYRTARTPLFDFKMNFAEERTRKRFAELVSPLDPEAQARDGGAFSDFLRAQSGVKVGPIGVVGYCFTGGSALRFAAARPDDVACAASFHGGGLVNESPASPHRLLPQIKARLYFGHAEGDRSMSAAQIATLESALAAWGGRYESEVYPGASHGWTMSDASVYDPAQAERAWRKLTELLSQTLS